MPRSIYLSVLGLLLAAGFSACAPTVIPFHGFADQAALDAKDAFVLKESAGGALDPLNLAKDDQGYEHDKLAYSRVEEGYYQWGRKMYSMGYRDVYYVRDLAPNAFRHPLMDTYDHDIEKGFEDAQKSDPTRK